MSRDKKVIIFIIVGILLLSLMGAINSPEVPDIVRFTLNCILCWFLWKGENWARLIAGILLVLASLTSIIFFLKTFGDLVSSEIFFVMFLFYTFSAYILLSQKFVEKHFKAKAVNNQLHSSDTSPSTD